MKEKHFSFVLVSAFLFAVTLLAFVNFHNANAQQQQRISFQGKYGYQQPYKLVEESSIPENIRKLNLSSRGLNQAGYIKVMVPYKIMPDARAQDEGFSFFDENRNVVYTKTFETTKIKPYELTETIDYISNRVYNISKYGNYVLVGTIVKHVSPVEDGIDKFEIFDSQGEKKWEEEVTRFYDQFGPFFYLSDYDGKFVKIIGTSIMFFDPQGTMLKKVPIFTESGMELVSASFSDNGEYFVLSVLEKVYYEDNPWFIMYTSQGEELWRFKGDGEYSILIDISPDGSYVIASTFSIENNRRSKHATYLIRIDGTLVKKYDGIAASKIDFSPESKHAVIIQGDKIHLIELESGDILLDYDYDFISGDLLSEKNLVAMAKGSRLVVLHFDGTPVFLQNLKTMTTKDPYTWHGVEVRLSEDGEEIFILAEKQLFRFRLQK